jgi:DNA-binding CsgD family transcriptional regulator
MTQNNLSPREAQILTLVASGRSTKEIGAELSIAQSTVNWHVGNVLTKLSASSRAEAVAVAYRSEKLDPAETPVPRPAAKPPLAQTVQMIKATLIRPRRRSRRPPSLAGFPLPRL